MTTAKSDTQAAYEDGFRDGEQYLRDFLKYTLNACHAHRTDMDYTFAECYERLSRLGIHEAPKGGPDNFYNGVSYVVRRMREALNGQTVPISSASTARARSVAEDIRAGRIKSQEDQ